MDPKLQVACFPVSEAVVAPVAQSPDSAVVPFPPPPSADAAEVRTCSICYESLPSTTVAWPPLHVAAPCTARENFACCAGCQRAFLASKIGNQEVFGPALTCPGLGCSAAVTPRDVRRLLLGPTATPDAEAKTLWVAYEAAYAEAEKVAAARDQRLRGGTCVGRLWTDAADGARFAAWRVGADTRSCPGCRAVIEKNGGCNHMTCRRCKHQFHWCCGQTSGPQHAHYDVLCWPVKLMNDPSPLWGPVLPVRTVTKLAAASAAVPAAAVAVCMGAAAVCLAAPVVAGCLLAQAAGVDLDPNAYRGPSADVLKADMERRNAAISLRFRHTSNANPSNANIHAANTPPLDLSAPAPAVAIPLPLLLQTPSFVA